MPIEKVSRIIDGVVDRIYHPQPGLMTGLTELDAITYGIHQKQLTIIAGRPSMGKSALALDVALNLIRNKQICAFFTLEDSSDMVVRRLLCKIGKVSMTNVRDNNLTSEMKSKLLTATSELRDKPLLIEDSAAVTPARLWGRVKHVKEKCDLKAVFVDYMQLLALGDRNRQEALEQTASLLKDMAKEFDVAVIVLSQLNRDPDKREDHTPRMSDLRGSGGLEQSADLCMLLYRPAYYTMQEVDINAEDDGESFIIVGKQKNGPTGKIRCGYVPEWMSFMDAPNSGKQLVQEGVF